MLKSQSKITIGDFLLTHIAMHIRHTQAKVTRHIDTDTHTHTPVIHLSPCPGFILVPPVINIMTRKEAALRWERVYFRFRVLVHH